MVNKTVPRLSLEMFGLLGGKSVNELSCWVVLLTLVLETQMMSKYITWRLYRSLTFLCFLLGCCCICPSTECQNELFLAACTASPNSGVLKRCFMDSSFKLEYYFC